VILSDVYPETPAERSGLKPGDIVISLDGKPMENGRQMQVNLYSRAVGDTVQLEIERGTTIQPCW
jgi:S1-C subfamily serine protease